MNRYLIPYGVCESTEGYGWNSDYSILNMGNNPSIAVEVWSVDGMRATTIQMTCTKGASVILTNYDIASKLKGRHYLIFEGDGDLYIVQVMRNKELGFLATKPAVKLETKIKN